MAAAIGLLAFTTPAHAQLPATPPVPPQNPITEAKRVLGKMLFWDEQLSFDNTVSCGTCHSFAAGGGDPRRARNPGPDGQLNTPDDIFGSPGVIASDSIKNYVRSAVFGLNPQITGRGSPSAVDSGFSPLLFWDGRATSAFIDPQTGQTLIPSGGALESQIVGPPVNSVEMGHEQIDWVKVSTKLAYARPMALATGLPGDLAAALAGKPTYGQLFAAAFGDAQVTAARVAFAIATYERTLVANQTPFDLGTMTPAQQQGLNAFNAAGSRCNVCHVPPLFSDNTFRNIGVRPPAEDTGRQAITNNPADRGRFKVPSLRNVNLRRQFMHNGEFISLPEAVGFYANRPAQFLENQDPLMGQIDLPPQAAQQIVTFLSGALTDPRVQNETFPFDRPTLYSQRPGDRPTLVGAGTAGAGGRVPLIIALDPPFIGNGGFRVGLDNALGGATARLITSSTPPDGSGNIAAERTMETKTTTGIVGVAGDGYATQSWPLTPGTVLPGQVVYAQWIIDDAMAPGGQSRSNVARITLFCGSVGCPSACEADTNEDSQVSVQDLFAYLNRWFLRDLRADLGGNGGVEVGDLFAYLQAWFARC